VPETEKRKKKDCTIAALEQYTLYHGHDGVVKFAERVFKRDVRQKEFEIKAGEGARQGVHRSHLNSSLTPDMNILYRVPSGRISGFDHK
jgi:hypothetical protein